MATFAGVLAAGLHAIPLDGVASAPFAAPPSAGGATSGGGAGGVMAGHPDGGTWSGDVGGDDDPADAADGGNSVWTPEEVSGTRKRTDRPPGLRGHGTSATHRPDSPCPQDDALRQAVEAHGSKDWAPVAKQVSTHSEAECQDRWHHVLRPGMVKGSWSEAVSARAAERGTACVPAVPLTLSLAPLLPRSCRRTTRCGSWSVSTAPSAGPSSRSSYRDGWASSAGSAGITTWTPPSSAAPGRRMRTT